MKTIAKLIFGAAAAALVATGPAGAKDKPLKFGYINKMGDHPWFVSEVGGAKAKAEELGAELLVQDVQFDSNLAITAFDTMVGDGVAGIAIVVPEQSLGPRVAEKAKEAGIPLIAVDDDIYYQDGTPVPYVGLDAYSIGRKVGEEIARIYRKEGWDKSGHEVRVASIEDKKAETCMKRNQGAEDAFREAVPDFPAENIIHVPYDNPMESAITNMTTTLTAYPQVTHWMFWSCNDDGVLGGVRAMENSGMGADQAIGVGIDGSRSCGLFGQGQVSGFRGTMWLNSALHGQLAIQLLHDAVASGKPLPEKTYSDPILVNEETFPQYKEMLGC